MTKEMPRLHQSAFRRSIIPALVIVLLLGTIVFLVVSRDSQRSPLRQQAAGIDISICDPAKGPFSLTLDNPFLPLPVGMFHVLESATSKVQISVLNQTEMVAGVTTRVVEERDWKNGSLSEVARNFLVQAPDGTVCYYGEEVDEYRGGEIVAHTGSWRAGTGQNKPGIMMPSHPAVGQNYQQEFAPGVAMDQAEHVAMN